MQKKKQKMKSIKFSSLLIILLFFSYCGGSAEVTPPTELPTVRSGDDILEAGQTTELASIPTVLSFSFENDIDPSTLTSENVTLSCEEVEDISFDIGSSNNSFDLIPTLPLPQKDTCTVTLGTGLTLNSLSAGLSSQSAFKFLSEELVYTFITPCSDTLPAREEFNNSETLSECWGLTDAEQALLSPDFDSSEGNVIFNYQSTFDTSSDGSINISLTNDTLPDNYTVEVKINSFNNLNRFVGNDLEMFQSTLTGSNNSEFYTIYIVGNNNSGINLEDAGNGSNSIQLGTSGDDSSEILGSQALFLRATKTGTNFRGSYRIGESGDFTDLGTSDMSIPGITDSFALFLIFHNSILSDTDISLDYVRISTTD
jgi:hypothetical protein